MKTLPQQLKFMLDDVSNNLNDKTKMLILADYADELKEYGADANVIPIGNLPTLLRLIASPDQHYIRDMMFTGSRAYGKPRDKEQNYLRRGKMKRGISYWDWVVRIGTWNRQHYLEPIADAQTQKVDKEYQEGGYHGDSKLDVALRYGPVNVICVSSSLQWDTWKIGTAKLVSEKPCSHSKAIAVLDAEFSEQKQIREEEEAEYYGESY